MDLDQAAYFLHQFDSSARMSQRFMQDVTFDDKIVLDVGSGLGGRAPYWIKCGARTVHCIDINQQELAAGQAILAQKHPELTSRITFRCPAEIVERDFADLAILFDTFEHLSDPAAVLDQCFQWLKPGGVLWVGAIGWYHYMASHCLGYIPIPWCQVLFSEQAIIRTIQRISKSPDYVPNVWDRIDGLDRWDKVTTLKDRPGEPLNMLSLRAVRKIMRASKFRLAEFKVHGFGGTRYLLARPASFLARIPVARELFHSYYTAILTKPAM